MSPLILFFADKVNIANSIYPVNRLKKSIYWLFSDKFQHLFKQIGLLPFRLKKLIVAIAFFIYI